MVQGGAAVRRLGREWEGGRREGGGMAARRGCGAVPVVGLGLGLGAHHGVWLWCKRLSRLTAPLTLPHASPPTCSAVERRSASALAVQKPYGQALQPPGARLVQQQHRIRQMGYGRGNTTFGSV